MDPVNASASFSLLQYGGIGATLAIVLGLVVWAFRKMLSNLIKRKEQK
jgi:hypothetical protein